MTTLKEIKAYEAEDGTIYTCSLAEAKEKERRKRLLTDIADILYGRGECVCRSDAVDMADKLLRTYYIQEKG